MGAELRGDVGPSSYGRCGERAHGSLESALRNGGCGHEFEWSTLAPRRNGKPGSPFNERQVLFKKGPADKDKDKGKDTPKGKAQADADGRSA